MKILDSGERTEFPSGAVRDMKKGKGRFDLVPLDVVGTFMNDPIIIKLGEFQDDTKRVEKLYQVLEETSNIFYEKSMSTMLLEVAIHFEEGAAKYGDNNWQKGVPITSYIDSATRHYMKVLRGDQDEPHLRAFVWNILCLIWTVEHGL